MSTNRQFAAVARKRRISETAWITTPAAASTRSDFTGWLGCKFSVVGSITISQLGRPFYTGNANNHDVGIFNSSGSPLVIGTVNCSSGTNAVFNWVTVANTVLTTGDYFLASLEASGGDTWRDQTTQTTTAAATVVTSVFRSGTGTTGAFSNSTALFTYVPPNFKYR